MRFFYTRPEQVGKTARVEKSRSSTTINVSRVEKPKPTPKPAKKLSDDEVIEKFNNLVSGTALQGIGKKVVDTCKDKGVRSVFNCARDLYSIAVIETSLGNSKGYKKSYNFASIHCTPSWQGKCIRLNPRDRIRVYSGLNQAVEDFIALYIRNKWENNNFKGYNSEQKWYRQLNYYRSKF